MHWSRVAAVVCVASALARPLAAQQSVDYASLGGRVTDPQGAVVAGAHVTARHTDTNVVAEAVTERYGDQT